MKLSNRRRKNKSENGAVSSFILNNSSRAEDQSGGVCRAFIFLDMKATALFCNALSLLRIKWVPLLQICRVWNCISSVLCRWSIQLVWNCLYNTIKKASDTFKQWLIGVIWGWGDRPLERSQGNHKRVSSSRSLQECKKRSFLSARAEKRDVVKGGGGVAEETAEG